VTASDIPEAKTFWAEDDGQDLIEYALLLGFLALATVAMLTSLSTSVQTLFLDVSKTLSNAAPSAS